MRVLLILSIFMIGCATAAKYEANLQTWVGQSEDSLVRTWGPPAESYQTPSGMRMLSYINASSGPTQGFYNPYTRSVAVVQNNYSCKTIFTIEHGLVSAWTWEGNSCRSK